MKSRPMTINTGRCENLMECYRGWGSAGGFPTASVSVKPSVLKCKHFFNSFLSEISFFLKSYLSECWKMTCHGQIFKSFCTLFCLLLSTNICFMLMPKLKTCKLSTFVYISFHSRCNTQRTLYLLFQWLNTLYHCYTFSFFMCNNVSENKQIMIFKSHALFCHVAEVHSFPVESDEAVQEHLLGGLSSNI